MKLFGWRRKKTLDGHAEIVECWGNPDKTTGNCKMTLRLDVPGIPVQDVRHHELYVNANRWPEVGMRVAVTVEADDPAKVDVDWDSVFGPVLGGPAGHVAQAAFAAIGVDADLSLGTEPRGGKPPPDFQEQVDELNRQFRDGEITYEEMSTRLMALMNGR